MKTVELVVSPALYSYRLTKKNHTTIVVDILRATTSICAAFQAGVEEVVPLNSLEPLPHYRELGYTLAAERNGEKIQNAQCGNSPTEYLTMNLKGQRLAYSTTNGTVGILMAANDSKRVLIGCFSNLSALVDILQHDENNLVILCSGWKNGVSIEDTLFAGNLIEQLNNYQPINDAANMAKTLYTNVQNDLYGYCQRGTHIHRLQRLNYDRDIKFAFKKDSCPVVPELIKGTLHKII